METNYKRTVAGSIGAGISSVFSASGKSYYILEHKTESQFHHAGESQKIIIDQIEIGRAASCQVRFDESQDTVSRRHAAIVREGNGWKIINLSQTNATFVNGQPIQGEWNLSSGDEIRLSSRGPVMGFIVPQGSSSMVSSIGLTERMNLFRKQALRPYKTAIIVICVVFILAIAALVAWNVHSNKQYQQAIQQKETEISDIHKQIDIKNMEYDIMKQQLENAKDQSEDAINEIRQKMSKSEAEKQELLDRSEALRSEIDSLKKTSSEPKEVAPAPAAPAVNENAAPKENAAPAETATKKEEAVEKEQPKKKTIQELINETKREDPVIK